MDRAKISFNLDATEHGVMIAVKLDGDVKWSGDPFQAGSIEFDISDEDGDHVFEIELSGKKTDHTQIDSAGQITRDLIVTISNICFDEINIDQIAYLKGVYGHDFNGTKPMVQDRFFGTMGCNGTVRLDFHSPIYLWLLENM